MGRQVIETSESATRPLLLLVDDQPIGLRALASIFENQGYELELASDGAEAIACLDRSQPDLVLLDVMMPVMDGFPKFAVRSVPTPPTSRCRSSC